MTTNVNVLINNLKLRLRTEKNGINDSLIRLGVQSSHDVTIFTSPIIHIIAIPNGVNQIFCLSSTNLLTGYKYNPSADTYSLNTSVLKKHLTNKQLELYRLILSNDINNANAKWGLGYYYKTDSNVTYAALYTDYAIYAFKYDLDITTAGGIITMIYVNPIYDNNNKQTALDTCITTIEEYKDA